MTDATARRDAGGSKVGTSRIARFRRVGTLLAGVVLGSAGTLVGPMLAPQLGGGAAGAAGSPALVSGQTAAASGTSSTAGGSVQITATLPAACTPGDTLVALVSVGQDASAHVGSVSAVPAGWKRLYEHAPPSASPFQAWFSLSNCSASDKSAAFTVASPGNASNTVGSVVLAEYSGLPNPVAVDFSTYTGSTSATSGSLTGGTPSAAGELTLTALTLEGMAAPSAAPTGWSSAGSSTGSLPAFAYWQVGTSSAPSASYSWSPSSAFEATMIALKPAATAENVVQEVQGIFTSSTSWAVSLPHAVTGGDALVALIGTGTSVTSGSHFEATSLSGGGVTWQKVIGHAQSGNGTVEVWVGFGSSGGTAGPVTATMAGTDTGRLVLAEVAGIAAVDASAASTGTSSTPTAGSITPTSGAFVVSLMTANASLGSYPTSDWSTFSMSGATGYASIWRAEAPHAASAPVWTIGASASWAIVQAAFTAMPAPTVTSVTPSSGPAGGGTSVTVTGTNFTGATAVKFGTAAATAFTVSSATSLTATSPSGSGTVDVTVTTPRGTSSAATGDRFTYVTAAPASNGYDLVGSDGGVFVFNNSGSGFYGSLPGLGIHVDNIVGIVPTSDEKGYWLVGSDGGVFAFGDAGFVQSLPGLGVHVNDIVGIVPTSTGGGYWLVGADGGVFAFGDAPFVQSLPGLGVHVSNIVGIASTPDNGGYWLVGADGGVYALGDANYLGGLGGTGTSVVGIAATSGNGYWLVSSNGSVSHFGDAGSFSDLPSLGVSVSNIVSLVPTIDDHGYYLVGSDGGIFGFGDATFVGSLPGLGVHVTNIVGAVPTT